METLAYHPSKGQCRGPGKWLGDSSVWLEDYMSCTLLCHFVTSLNSAKFPVFQWACPITLRTLAYKNGIKFAPAESGACSNNPACRDGFTPTVSRQMPGAFFRMLATQEADAMAEVGESAERLSQQLKLVPGGGGGPTEQLSQWLRLMPVAAPGRRSSIA
ncbi:hypothetical protein K438DRAFT_1756830 [Mycena galopus ATCC 62051]|nr:hypothetical protein K438DRAFT_1756830 [Mycena galopus ATCC 62051]